MKKLLLLIMLFPAIVTHMAWGQVATATLGNYNAAPGTEVVVPVMVTDFNNVAAISLYFEYDPNVLIFNRSENPATGFGAMDVNGSLWPDGKYRIGIAWSPGTAASVTGKLVDVVFDYVGGTSDLIWTEDWCVVTTLPAYEDIPVIYTNGNISPVGEATVDISDQLMVAPGPLSIPLNVDFSGVEEGVSSFTFVVLYDDNILTFQNISDFASGFDNIQIYQFASPTRLVLDWLNPDPFAEEGSFLNGMLLNMNFNYAGGNTTLTFDENACAMANNEVIEVSVIYAPGQVTQDPASMITVSLPHILEDPGTTGVEFPLTVTNFENIAAFDLRVVFDPAVLSFVGLDNYLSPLNELQFQINVAGGQLGISWIGSPITVADDKLFDIVFNYNSGFSALAFDEENSSVSNDNLIEQAVIYNDGSISEDMVYEATATIPNLLATIGQTVDVPVYVTGFENLGAINFDMEFDAGVLNFLEGVSVHSGLISAGTHNFNVSGTHLFFDWVINPFLEDGPNIPDNDILFMMRFHFNGGTSPLAFNVANCAVSRGDENITPILVTYTDGSVYGGIVSLTNSTITANRTELEVGETSIITVQLKDQLGNNLPASGGVVELFTDFGTLSTVTDHNNGTYTATLSSAGSGIRTITGKLNGDDFADNAEVRFYYILTLELDGCGTYSGAAGWVRINGIDYDQANQQISISTPTTLLESVTTGNWKLYSWTEDGEVELPRGAATYTITMDQDKTVKATFHLPGDANGDGVVNVLDARHIINYSGNLLPPDAIFCFENADVNNDGSVNVLDARQTINLVGGN